jgi:hypothetical protein
VAKNRVEVLLSGIDELSPMIRGAVVQANLMDRALNAAFTGVSRVVGSAVSAFQDASSAQLDTLKSVAGLENVFEMPHSQAEQLNQEITVMLAKLAAPLPGTTDDYLKLFRQISDDVAIANKDLNNGTVDLKSYKEQVGEITSKWTVLGQGLSVFQRNNALRGLLSGDSLKTLRKLEFFEANPQVLKALKDAEELAGKPLQKMGSGERLQVLLKALDVSMTDDTLKRMTGTLDANVQTFMSTLFDPTTGIFGLQKDLDNQRQGVQSAFMGISETITALIGGDGLFFALGNLLKALGVEFIDPMQQLRNTALYWAMMIRRLAEILNGGAAIASAMDRAAFLKDNIGKLVGVIAGSFNRMLAAAAGIDYKAILGTAGKLLAELINQASGVLKTLDYRAIATTAGRLLEGLMFGFATSLSSLSLDSWISIASIIGGIGLTAMATSVLGSAAASFVAAWGFAIHFIAPALIPALASVPVILVGAAVLAMVALGKAIYAHWPQIWGGIKLALDSLGNVVVGGFKILWGFASGQNDLMKSGLEQFLGGLTGIFDWLNARLDDVKAQLGVQTSGQATADDVAMRAEQRFQAARGLSGDRPASPGSPTTAPAIPHAAGGFGGLLGGLFNELQQMPSGASPIVANSTEAILNQAQQRSLAARLGGSGGGGNLSVGSLTINTAATNVEGIARDVMAAIAAEYRQFQQSKLTAIG